MKRCSACQGTDFQQKPSVAKCGHRTSYAGVLLCCDCAKKDGACEGCGVRLAKPVTADDYEGRGAKLATPPYEEEYELPPHTD